MDFYVFVTFIICYSDCLCRMAFQEHGLSEDILTLVSHCIGCSNSEIQVIWLHLQGAIPYVLEDSWFSCSNHYNIIMHGSCLHHFCFVVIVLSIYEDLFAFWDTQDRYNILREKYEDKHDKSLKGSSVNSAEKSILLDKSLGAALDSFDNLFCRRCLVLDNSGLIFVLVFHCSIPSLDCVLCHANMFASIE